MSSMSQLLTPGRCLCRARATSKKQVFELIADTLAREHDECHTAELVAGMLAREKLGSTGLGDGIAIPHCRLRDIEEPSGVLVTLVTPAPFDAPDDRDVDLLFALVVPTEATQEHLNILAELARLFSQPRFCQALRECGTSEALHATALNWVSEAS